MNSRGRAWYLFGFYYFMRCSHMKNVYWMILPRHLYNLHALKNYRRNYRESYIVYSETCWIVYFSAFKNIVIIYGIFVVVAIFCDFEFVFSLIFLFCIEFVKRLERCTSTFTTSRKYSVFLTSIFCYTFLFFSSKCLFFSSFFRCLFRCWMSSLLLFVSIFICISRYQKT